MKKYSLAFWFLFLSCFLVFLSCKKINEATELGSDLIPAIDNITTFDTALAVETYNGIFTEAEDSAKSTYSDIHFLGTINNDPLFGKSEAALYVQLKPGAFKYTFPFTPGNLVALDSVVLVLGYNQTYGDTMLPQQVAVYEIPPAESFRWDSAYFLRENNFTTGVTLGPAKTFIPLTLNDSVFPYNERGANQLRIPLDIAFGQRLLNYDTTNAYASDSAFNMYFNGFAVVPQNNAMANALVGFNLSDTNTKLSFYVRYNRDGKTDTSVINFKLAQRSATANYINRDYSGSQLASYQNTSSPADLLFIQSTPGTYATIKIPGLNNLTNRIVHRAELIVEQVADPSDKIFPPPTYLFLDAYDSAQGKFRTIPFDYTINATSQANTETFGMVGKPSTDASGNTINTWRFDVSRYIQHVVNKTGSVYFFRLSAPYRIKDIYSNGTTGVEETLPLINPVYAAGRVRVGGGNHPTQRMRLRIIYSKL